MTKIYTLVKKGVLLNIKKARIPFKKYSLTDYFILFQVIFLFLFLILFYEESYFHKSIAVYASIISLVSLQLLYKNALKFPRLMKIPTILFIIGLSISLLFSKVVELSSFQYLFYLSNILTLGVSYSLLQKDKNNLKIYPIIITILSSIIIILFAIFESINKDLLTFRKAFIGPFYWHNQMAGFLLFFTPSIFVLLTVVKSNLLKILIALLGVVFGFLLFLTFSRGGWMIFSIISLMTAFRYRVHVVKHKKTFLYTTAVLLLSLALLFTISPKFQKRSSQLYNDLFSSQRTTSGKLRISTYSSAFSMFTDYPVQGVGLGAFGEAMYKYQKAPWLYAKYTHNHYLQLLSEGGVITFAGFILVLFIPIYKSFRRRNKLSSYFKNNRGEGVIFFGLLMAFISSMLHNTIDVDWNYPALSFLFWFSLGIFSYFLELEKIKVVSKAKKGDIVLSILLVLLLFSSLILNYYEKQVQAGQITYANQEYERSDEYFTKALSIFPYSYRSLIGLGYSSIGNNNPEKSLDHFTGAIESNPFNANPLFQKYLLNTKLGNLSQIEKEVEIENIMELNPYAQPFYYTEGYRVFLQSEQSDMPLQIIKFAVQERFPISQSFEDFRYIYDKQIDFKGNLFDLHLTYALLLKSHGEQRQSDDAIRNAISIYNSSKEFQNILKSLEESNL